MSDPFTAALVGLQTASTLSEAAAETNRADLSAQLARQAAARTDSINAQRERNARRNASASLANRKARFGRAGVTLEGSPLMALADLAADARGELDELSLTGRARAESATGRSLLLDQQLKHRKEAEGHERHLALASGAKKLLGSWQP